MRHKIGHICSHVCQSGRLVLLKYLCQHIVGATCLWPLFDKNLLVVVCHVLQCCSQSYTWILVPDKVKSAALCSQSHHSSSLLPGYLGQISWLCQPWSTLVNIRFDQTWSNFGQTRSHATADEGKFTWSI
jgi:hypothetical protein